MPQMTVDEAIRLKRDYVCSRCWGEFIVTFNHGASTVTCDKCGPIEHFVTRKYAERRLAESHMELLEAKSNLGKFIQSDHKEDIF